ncbi:MAG TPA: hypothetical protein VHB68_02285 [Steroidobacteraceae bacterium]|nr:hypothetical protein [Steroidobacteraceae bacterium]
MSSHRPSFYFGAGNVANGGPAGGPALRKENRMRKGWTAFDVWQDRVRRAAEAARLAQVEAQLSPVPLPRSLESRL